jgi:pimeloyl-ACP methyl ester carboxylesterase
MSLAAGVQTACHWLPDCPWFWNSFLDCANVLEGWAGWGLPEWVVPSRVLSYTARRPCYDALGQALLDEQGGMRSDRVHLSGRVFFPPAWRARRAGPLPVVLFTHGSCLRKDGVPSTFRGHEWIVGAAAAAWYGMVVVMPDLPGLGGDSCSFHPYCHRRSLAYALVDALPEVRRMLREDPALQRGDYRWDPRLFLMGYSEGGLASLAAARELETKARGVCADNGFVLAGTVCMGAPYDLGRIILNAVRSDTPSAHCFYLPYIILGAHAVYGRIVDPLEVFAPVLLESRSDGNVLQWAAGGMDLLEMDAALARRLGVTPGKVVLRRLLNPAWVEARLECPNLAETPLGRIMQENHLVEGWAPAHPILLAHSPDDRDVPGDGAAEALETLANAVRLGGRDPSGLLQLRHLSEPGEGVGHICSFVPGLVAALGQIEAWRAHRPEQPPAP